MSENVNKTVYVIFISLLLDLLAFTMILPLLPSLLDHYRINDNIGLYPWLSSNIKTFQEFVGAPNQFNSVLFGGFLGSMFSFLQFLASPIFGGLSDVYGRKPIMMICLVHLVFIRLVLETHDVGFRLVYWFQICYGLFQPILLYL